tara:strand:+ start:1817 stop:2320 length:504 start_codon:yes stop_codon:yes gene_type:complete
MKFIKLKNIQLFLGVIFLQVFILNNIQLSGYINPYYYIVFILFYPSKNSLVSLLLSSFLMGFIIDIFCDSYGMHAFTSVLIAYLKIIWLKTQNYKKESEELFEMKHLSIGQFIITSWCFIIIHHFTLFCLESFSFYNLFSVFQITLASSIFTLLLIIIHKILSVSKA